MSVIAGDYSQVEKTAWVGNLSFQDLERLRASVRRVHMAKFPAELITNKQVDKLIEALGPMVAERLTKRLVDGKIK